MAFDIKFANMYKILCNVIQMQRNCEYECFHIYNTSMQLGFLMSETSFVRWAPIPQKACHVYVDVFMISIRISFYQVFNRFRKNVKIIVRARIFPINYPIWPKMNMMQKIIFDRKWNIVHRFFSIFGYFNLVYSAWRYLQDC